MKNYRYIVIYILFLSTLTGLSGCYDDLESINENPNNPTEVPPSFLLSNAQRDLTQEILGVNDEYGHADWSIQYMQYFSSTLYTQTTRYSTVQANWNDFYQGGLADLQEIIELNRSAQDSVRAAQYGSNDNQIAVAKILQVWGFHNITDIWGDAPFQNALQGSENFSPSYTPQSEIYEGLIIQLDSALMLMDPGEGGPEGDLIFEGDMASWKRFANSLKLRLGMRMSDVAPQRAETIVNDAVNGGVISSVEENVEFPYIKSSPNFNPWYFQAFVDGGAYNQACANTLIDSLKGYNDPRLYEYAAPAEQSGEFIGIPFGVESAVASSYANTEVSFQTDQVYNSPGKIMSYSEVLLLQAEAAQKGWISGSPADFYEQGIRASMNEWNVPDSVDIDAYLEQEAIAYEADSYKQKIGRQLWLVLYMQPLEAWAKWRRLDYPLLADAPDAFQGRNLPVRRGYPNDESDLNRKNYEEAVARQGPDNLSTNLWWDVE